MTLRYYQRNALDELDRGWTRGLRCQLLRMGTGTGKCFRKGTLVLMADGATKPVEEIQVGDLLASPTGGVRTVLSLARGRETMYRVTPAKGDPYVVNASHLLSLQVTNTAKTARLSDGTRIVPGDTRIAVPAKVFAESCKSAKHVLKGWRSGVARFAGGRQPLPLPPYILGIWLGDGTAKAPSLTKPEGPVVEAWRQYGKSLGLECRNTDPSRDCPAWYLTAGYGQKNHLLEKLRGLNLIDNKHVPHIYKTASVADRLELIAGMLDTDGHMTCGGYDWISVSRELAEGFAFLCRSVGLACYLSESQKSIKSLGFTGTYWRCSVSGDCERIPCRAKPAPARQQKKRHLVHGITLTELPEDDYYGFALDGDHLFLLADFTVVHNSKTSAHALADNTGGGLMMAHRREIVAQLALALAREGVRHRVIGPPELARLCMQVQIEDLGTHFVAPGSRVGVASTDSLAVVKGEEDFLRQVTLAVPDEFHHYLRDNAYGKAVNRLRPECRILGPTATPARTDGKGLGEWADGFAQEIVHGPTEAQMMAEGFLCQYRIYVPPTDFNRGALGIGSGQEFKKEDVKREAQRSHIFGDAVKHYCQRSAGKTALAFVDSIENAVDLCTKFRAAGVRAEVLSGKTEVGLRSRTLKAFARGGVDIIISVQLIDEGFDCPSVQVVLDLAATTSLIRYRQRFGRGWRPDASKEFFTYFDFVGNVNQHGLPEAYRKWSLDRRQARGKSEANDHIPTRTCENPKCGLTYERVLPCCPYCLREPTPATRNSPEVVDGDLILLDEATRARMLGEIARIDQPAAIPYGATYAVAGNLRNIQHAKQQAQASLRHATALWGGWQAAQGRSEREGYRRFYHRYGIDLYSAWALGATDAAGLEEKIRRDLSEAGIIDGSVK